MPESSTQPASPSLEQILWRSMDRLAEEPALLDAEEFAAHIAHAFEVHVPEEDFADRFLADLDRLHQPRSLAQGVVRRAAQRLHVYEFDLDRLEYVIVEDRDKVVVVSSYGQFTLPGEDALGRALQAAIVKAPDRLGTEPRGYFVRRTGEVVGLDVKKVARTLERSILRQISAPAVEAPARRLVSFHPVRRTMSPAREERALRQDPRLDRPAAPPQTAELEAPSDALVLKMPDGSLARARIGAAHRWERMLGQRARAAGRRIAIQAGGVVVIVDGAPPLSAGERALAQGEAVAAVRSEGLPVRALAGDQVAQAFVAGARLVPALGGRDRFWVHPEQAFLPELASTATTTMMARPLELGEMTGDPWTDWAITAGAPGPAAPLRAAAADRGGSPAGPAIDDGFRTLPQGQPLRLAGAAPVAFRAADGTIFLNSDAGPARLAAVGRPASARLRWLDELARPSDVVVSLRSQGEPAPRAGAVPWTALQSLQVALERTAAAGAYRLPLARLESTADAIDVGASLPLGPFDARRSAVRMAGPELAADGTVRLVLSMPFPNRGELHVGDDLAAALDSWLAAPIALVPRTVVAPATLAAAPSPAAPLAGGPLQKRAARFDLPAVHPLLAADPSISDLPYLLTAAVAQNADWTPIQDATLPPAVRAFAVPPPFARDAELVAAAAYRPPRAGEDEIVIPLPLWAQMGRGVMAETARIMASPVAPTGNAPPLGAYRLVVPEGGPLDLSGGGAGAVETVDLSGPTGLHVALRPTGIVTASTLGGTHVLGRVPMEESAAPAKARGRIRIGAPLEQADLSTLVSRARESATQQAASLDRSQLVAPARATSSTPPPIEVVVAPERTAPSSIARFQETEVVGVPAGTWSGHRPGSAIGFRQWSYAPGHADRPQSVGDLELAGLSRAHPPQLPIALRFRYVGAPLWWSGGSSEGDTSADWSATAVAMRSGLRATNSAAAIWRSILVAGAAQDNATGGMGADREASADAMSSVARRFDAASLAPVANPNVPSAAAVPAYVAMSASGAAGPVSQRAAARARAQSVEMSIVAAIPPAPPPLESMSSVARGAEAAHARGRSAGHPGRQEQLKDADDAVSHSKIEGSVDAIAQRIYHRIRRRIQSDRERFGG